MGRLRHWAAVVEQRLPKAGLDQRVALVPHAGAKRLTRQDIIEMARPVAARDSADVMSSCCSGTCLPGVRVEVSAAIQEDSCVRCRGGQASKCGLLRDAVGSLGMATSRSAYGTLIRRSGGQIPGLGPAYFTKFLYFVSEGADGTRCLILDARVAGSLARAGWTSLPRSKRTGYSYNWYTATYVSYCELLGRWAAGESASRGHQVWPDEIERALSRPGELGGCPDVDNLSKVSDPLSRKPRK